MLRAGNHGRHLRVPGRFIRTVLLAAVAITLAVSIAFAQLTIEVVLLTFLGILVTAPIVVRLIQGRFDLFEPLVTFAAAWAIMFVARPVAMLVTGTFVTAEGAYQVREGFLSMLLLATAGGLGFVIGYAIPIGRHVGQRIRSLPGTWNIGAATVYSLFLVAAGLGLFSVFIAQSGGVAAIPSLFAGRLELAQLHLSSQSTTYFGGAIALTFPAGLLLVASGAMAKRRGIVFTGLAVLGLGLSVNGPEGIRSWLIVFLGAPLVLLYLRKGRRPSALAVLLLAFIGFTVGITFVGSARDSSQRERVGVVSLLSQSATALGEGWDRFILGWDTEMASLLSLETMVVPYQIPFQNGAATGEVFVHAVPRQLWADKPRPGDELLTRRYFIETGLTASPRQYSPLADFYLDFGYIGGLLGMALLGVSARAHWEYFVKNASQGGVQLLFAATLPFWIVLMRGSVADTLGRLAFVVPPILLGLYLTRKRNRAPRRLLSDLRTSYRVGE
jgi:hypothetical protein